MKGILGRARYLLTLCLLVTLAGITRQLLKINGLYRQQEAEYARFVRPPRPDELSAPSYVSRNPKPVGSRWFRIAVGGALTSKRANIQGPEDVGSLPLFWQLLPGFCQTASAGYEYHFYFGYDRHDPIGNGTLLAAVDDAFRRSIDVHCSPRNVTVGRLTMIGCRHDDRPAWAQNDAMMAAYLDGMDFFYRINDDTRPTVAGWTEAFVGALARLRPPFVGVVGPSCSIEPPAVMSHDFVHRTHVDIFGFYYPRRFTDWYADAWMTLVYKPHRSVKLTNVTVYHAESMGRRYAVREYGLSETTRRLAEKYSRVIDRYIEAHFLPKTKPARRVTGQRVISMSVHGSSPRYVFGVIRNAQLMPIVYPTWRLRVYYHPKPEVASEGDRSDLYVADNVLESLVRLGAELIPVTDRTLLSDPGVWPYLALDDHENVEYAMIRNADARITAREARLVDDWLTAAHVDHAVHCIRDHPSQGITPLMDGLWGGKGKSLRYLLGKDIGTLLRHYLRSGRTPVERLHSTNSFLIAVWNGTAGKAFCHDSVTCQLWNGSHPAVRLPDERDVYVGERFDAFYDGVGLSNRRFYESPECTDDDGVGSATDVR